MSSDELSRTILGVISASDRPLSISDIASRAGTSWHKARTRLNRLKDSGAVDGCFLHAPGQGIWIWYRRDAFRRTGGD